MLAGSNAGVVVHRLLSLSLAKSDTRRAHCTHTQEPKAKTIRYPNSKASARVRPPSSRDQQQREGEEEKKKTEKRGEAAGFHKRMEGRRPRTFYPTTLKRQERNKKCEKQKRKEEESNNQKKCVCVVHLVSRRRSSCHQYSIPFRRYSMMMYTFGLFFSFFLSFSQPEYIRNNGSRQQCSKEE
ncbi:hypothetical protein DAPPUDRAFT_305274 [Daphnia pulex]|uniref:Transmembrane protein n=1 Tax=Daphnia pulex TaxID=6669 RepID=E9GRB7_DAPPU|nr:hypothetical protein DAPPUDRAFT_305274 [Daphnia pulex]|eukprot:EFX77983.1 hypothetical protein DAPPUDRAFT_305274 [Daphnia pulex]